MTRGNSDYLAFRFGLGPARPGEDWSPDAMVQSIMDLPAAQRFTLPSTAERLAKAAKLRAGGQPTTPEEAETRKAARGAAARETYRGDVHRRVMWAVETTSPFADRILAFWSNHFTVARNKALMNGLVGPFEAEAIMPHLGGSFVDLLRAAVMHPAMRIYLDQTNSIGPNSPAGKRRKVGLNENLAREILELHTLGVHGGYNQADVMAFAAIMTGWSLNRNTGASVFRPGAAEPGSKILLGQSFGGRRPNRDDFDSALVMIAAHPATARHIATKLVTHFISDEPPKDAVTAVENAFRDSKGHLPRVYQALASLPQAGTRPGAKARNGRDFLIAALRATGITGDKLASQPGKSPKLAASALVSLRQPYWEANSPAGWPEAANEWLSPTSLASRLQLIPRLIRLAPATTPDDLLDKALGSVVSPATRRIVTAASNRAESLALVLASPEFNRR